MSNLSLPAYRAFTPADKLIVGYNALLAIVWMFALGRYGGAIGMVALHIGFAVLPWGMARINPDRSTLAAIGRYVYPLILVVFYWTEAGHIHEVFHEGSRDLQVVAMDLGLTGIHLHEVFAVAIPWAWFAELMSVMYFLYYPVVFLTPAILVFRKQHEATRDIVYTLGVAYCMCFLWYIAFPVLGPKTFLGITPNAGTEAAVYGFVDALVHAGDSLGTAFPSSHVVGTVVMALLAAKWFSRPWALFFGIEAAGVMASTVYAQHHYTVDMIVGTLGAFAVFFIVAPALKRVFEIIPGRPLPQAASQPVASRD